MDGPRALPEVELGSLVLHALSRIEVVEHVLAELDAGRGGWVVTPNLDFLRRARRDAGFRALCGEATLRVVDGQPLVWALALQRTPVPERVAGSDLVGDLAAGAAERGRSVFLLGGNPGTAERAADALRARHPSLRVAGTACPAPGFEADALALAQLAGAVRDARPDLVFVALGSPKQEQVIRQLRADLPRTWWLGVGIALSFLAGEVRRAPRWMRRAGLEWLHRLAQEPGRLGARYLVHGLPFAARLLAGAAVRGALPMGRRAGPYGPRPPRALLADDDPLALEHLELLLATRFPELEITARRAPDVSGAFDFYFLDNDFDGQLLAGRLAREIRERDRAATVVAFSGRLDADTLKRLINAGCDGAAEKGLPGSWRPILELIERRLERMAAAHRRASGPFGGVRSAARSIRDLLEGWNARERRSA